MKNVIPEFLLLEIIKLGLKFIAVDLDEQVDETNSYLYQILQGQELERYNHFDQAKNILIREEDDPRLLNVDLMYNMDFDRVPSIYVSLSGEQHSQNNLSVEQSSEPIYQENSYQEVFTRRKNANYGIYIVSDNSNEVNLLYHIIDCIILSSTIHLSLVGLYNLTQGGQDIQIDSDKIPKHIFIKTLNIGMQYKRSAPSFAQIPMYGSLFGKGIPSSSKNEQ